MDEIFDSDIAKTAQLLKLDRLLVLRFKYENFFRNSSPTATPEATVEVAYDWHSKNNLDDNQQFLSSWSISYPLSSSSLTICGWQKAPEIIKISEPSQFEELELDHQLEQTEVFDLQTLRSLVIIPLCKQNTASQYKPLVFGLLVMECEESRHWQMADLETGKWI